jgi:hypothetical protein
MENEIKEFDDFSQIQFINDAEIKNEVYLFKSIEEAKLGSYRINEEGQTHNTSIAVINNSDEKIIEIINHLCAEYKKVLLIVSDEDFTAGEISNISFKVDGTLYKAKFNYLGFFDSENLISSLLEKINKNGQILIGEKIKLSNDSGNFLESEDMQKYIFYKNMLIKTWVEIKSKGKGTSNIAYFEVLTNYAFKIQEIIINADDENQRQDLKIELTDIEGNVSYVQISAKDKYSIAGFRKIVCQAGSYIDFMTNVDFNKVINQLYMEKDYKIVHKYNRPGLIKGKNVWLLSDEVISLED